MQRDFYDNTCSYAAWQGFCKVVTNLSSHLVITIMKKTLLALFAIISLGLSSHAQEYGFKQKDLIIEGSFRSAHENNRNTEIKRSNFDFFPQVGYFVSDKIAIGLYGQASGQKHTDYSGTSDTYTRESWLGGGVFGRYYFLELGNRFKTYAQLSTGASSSDVSNYDGNTTTKGDGHNYFRASAGIGINYFITPRIAVNLSLSEMLGYSSTKSKADGAEAISEFRSNVNIFHNFFETTTFGLTFKF